jgi:hypothetical protein
VKRPISIEIEVDVYAENAAAAGRLADRLVEWVAEFISDDPAFDFSDAPRPTCRTIIRDES